MDIFNANSRLRELAMYALDWGIYLRHDMDSSIAPFLLLKNGKDTYFRKLITDGNPIEFAASVLQEEEKPFEQFVIGFEGYLRDDSDNRVDSIVIQGFDVTQDKGVILGQMFNPKENGGFRKIDKITFLGNPDMIIDKKNNPADYSVEEIAVTGFSVQENDGLKYVAAFVHDNPSVIANEIKHYLRSRFTDEKRSQVSGSFDLNILDEEIKNVAFLKFLVTNAINEEIETDNVKKWQSEIGKTLNIKVKHGENIIYEAVKISSNTPASTKDNDARTDYAHLTQEQLNEEFHRIVSIPNARTNITALTQMSALMKEYKKRGLEYPEAGLKPNNKTWWQFWK